MRKIHAYMPDGGEKGVIQLWWAGASAWTECRGPAYSDWFEHVPAEETEASDFYKMHFAMGLAGEIVGLASVLHADEIVTLMPERHGHAYRTAAAYLGAGVYEFEIRCDCPEPCAVHDGRNNPGHYANIVTPRGTYRQGPL